MTKEKRILSYFMGWLLVGFLVCFIGITDVFAETYTPSEIKSQIRTIYTDGTTQWYTSNNGEYGNQLYFGSGPTYSTSGIPCNFRLMVVNNIDSEYSYKYNYYMTIYTPYSTNNTWDSKSIDKNYDLKVLDDAGIVKESKCSVVNTDIVNGNTGIYTTKEISCVFSVNKNYTNAYISAGYFCKGNCELSNIEPLGFIPQDSYMTITSPTFERFIDNSNVIIDQNQTIIDQNNQTNEELGNIKDNINDMEDSIIENNNQNTQDIIDSNKETQDVIKDQFNNCGSNLINKSQLTIGSINTTNGNNTNVNTRIRTDFIEIQKNIEYLYSINENYLIEYLFYYDDNYLGFLGIQNNTGKITFTNGNKIKLRIKNIDGTQLTQDDIDNLDLYFGSEEICTNKLDEANETSKGIWQTIKELPSMFLDMLLGLFIPEDLSFIENFKDVISNKLGFIASIPIQIIDFALGLVNVAFDEITTINFPSFEVFGVRFWNAEDIDITILLEKLKPFKYFTDLTCVILCCRTLYDLYHNFTGGGAN